uniref:4Fe-4S ferredoxin-type domain-containing protein n=1 Tax=Anopheles funestus TaxID=62324 RepID=A0A182R9Y8_ANOFN
MNWTIVLLFAAGCGICAAQSSGAPAWKGLIPMTAGAKCPISECRRNEVLKVCGLCYDNTCPVRALKCARKFATAAVIVRRVTYERLSMAHVFYRSSAQHLLQRCKI